VVCHWEGSNRIVVRELRSSDFVPRGAVTVESGLRPARVAFNASRQLLAWSESLSSKAILISALSTPTRRIEIRSDLPGLLPRSFSDDGTHLMAAIPGQDTSYPLSSLRVWAVETGQTALALGEPVFSPIFVSGGRAMAAVTTREFSHEVLIYDLANPGGAPRRIPGKELAWHLAVSSDGSLLASSTFGGKIRLFDLLQPGAPETLDAHLNGAFALAFSADGRRLISTTTGRESLKIWDVQTRQELLTLGQTGFMAANETSWSADGNVILAGPPWRAWHAPSWEEIAAAESKDAPAPGYGGQGKVESQQP
jgi:WD40 repeat protein